MTADVIAVVLLLVVVAGAAIAAAGAAGASFVRALTDARRETRETLDGLTRELRTLVDALSHVVSQVVSQSTVPATAAPSEGERVAGAPPVAPQHAEVVALFPHATRAFADQLKVDAAQHGVTLTDQDAIEQAAALLTQSGI